MKYYSCLFLVVFFTSLNVFSQENLKQHTVLKGETISGIAKKYNIKPSAIYEINPDAVNGIKLKSVLLIPSNSKNNVAVSTPLFANKATEKTHEVLPKETVYGIAKQHNVTINDLYKINPNLEKEGLKIGQTIKISQTLLEDVAVVKEIEKPTTVKNPILPNQNLSKQEIVVAPKIEPKTESPTLKMEYEVLPKESLYSIAKKYGISLVDLQKANPILENSSLKVGQKINVPVKSNTISNPVVADKEAIILAKGSADEKKSEATNVHEVLPKESLYSIAKQHGITLSELQKANSELGNKSLKVGQKINLPLKPDANPIVVVDAVKVKTEQEVAVVPQIKFEGKKPETEMTHEVLPKETKYGIAKEYGLTVRELEKQNPNISKKLLVGSVLKIRTSKVMGIKAPIEDVVVVKEDLIAEKGSDLNNNIQIVDKLISTASENMGIKYRYGGMTKDGFDCSGFMCYTFGANDISLPRTSMEMADYGSKIDSESAQKGDLIFFKTGGKRRINHVGMVVEVLDGEIKFIHSSTSSGVMISSTKEPYFGKYFAQVNRVLPKQL